MIRRAFATSFLRLTIVIGLLFAAALLSAQTPGGAGVTGTVRDSDGAAIPGVTVTASKTADPAASVVEVTDGNGSFRIRNLAQGEYVLDVTLDGFKPVSRRIALASGQKIEVAFTVVPAVSSNSAAAWPRSPCRSRCRFMPQRASPVASLLALRPCRAGRHAPPAREPLA